ncbi:PhoH family protein [Patescibacteria group bacterium]|nr:PhoH family protein [Patescibacteria group bacterium]
MVVDTNAILHHPDALNSFGDNQVVICLAVLEELDKWKKGAEEINRNARIAIRLMDSLRETAKKNGEKMADGVSLPNGGKLQIFVNHTEEIEKVLAENNIKDAPDNRIIAVGLFLQGQGDKVILVSKDINMRLKADALGIDVQDFEKNKTNQDESFEELRILEISPEKINAFYEGKGFINEGDFFPNEFIQVIDKGGLNEGSIGRVNPENNLIKRVILPEKLGSLTLRNQEQKMAAELLLDPKVEIVALVGGAGTGKTMLALKAGLHLCCEKNLYEKMLVSRPIIPMGKDIGYLPGTKDEKLSLWMQPIFDNLHFLLGQQEKRPSKESCKNYSTEEHQKESVSDLVADLMKKEIISLEALTYVRGRSIPRQYVIIDEAQNLTPHEVKTIVTRIGENTKIIFTGDPEQIDNPYLDSRSNGLSYLVERMSVSKIFGFVQLVETERSRAAQEGARLL